MSYLDNLDVILTKYQNYVGEYDKARWEQTVEQRILNGINNIPTKSAKVPTDLIDLDLVRGSSFPKAKPKHGLFTVTRLALLRFLFLPLFYKWWATQTSPKLFTLFVVLYTVQILNILVFTNFIPYPGISTTEINSTNKPLQSIFIGPEPLEQYEASLAARNSLESTTVHTSEIVSPMVIMIVLTVLLSHIVSTHGPKPHSNRKNKLDSLKPRRNSGSGIARKQKKTVRASLRKRSITGLNASKKSSLQEQLSYSSSIVRNQSTSQPGTSCPIRKVFFEDESKTWTSSNSEKDEGIAEETLHEIIDADNSPSLRDSSNSGSPTKQQNDPPSLNNEVMEDTDNDISLNNEVEEIRSLLQKEREPIHEDNLRSNLRKRHLNKRCGTNMGGADCSSNNNESSTEEEGDVEDEEMRNKCEWTGVTTCSEDFEIEEQKSEDEFSENLLHDHPFAWEFQNNMKPSSPSCPSADKVSCTIWNGEEARKADLSVLDISSMIVYKVDCARQNSDYLYLGILLSVLLAMLPCVWRLNVNVEMEDFRLEKLSDYFLEAVNSAFGLDIKSRVMIIVSVVERLCLAVFAFFLLAVAEKTYKQRFLCAKLFSRLTSSRKAKKSGLPHFRLNKVRNIKIWLSVRSYLQKRGPLRSVDTIVSATFITSLILIFFLSVELLKDSDRMYYLYNVEISAWSLCLGIFLLRFMTLGSRISQKYRNLSVLITEQLNLYLKMEQKPNKKEELLVANNVLKLASDLLKELDDPFKISSFASNPYLYNITRLVILSAFSGVLSEMLGFKLKLYKIKLK